MSETLPNETDHPAVEAVQPAIKIVGVGGAGLAALARIHASGLKDAQLCALDTDAGALALSPVAEKLMVGQSVTRGLSAGGEVDVGRRAAEADRERIAASLEGAKLVFILAGLGGGTGSGAAPVIAQVASQSGALVVVFATMPFIVEGARRHRQAEDALKYLRMCGGDSIFTLPNDLLMQSIGADATAPEVFQLAGQWICRGVGALCRSFSPKAAASVDFGTVQKLLVGKGSKTLFALGRGEGEKAFEDAIDTLMGCPLMRVPHAAGQTGNLLAYLCAKPDFDIALLNKLSAFVAEKFPFHASLSVCAYGYESLGDAVEVYLFGAGEAVKPKTSARAKPAEEKTTSVTVTAQEEFGFVQKEAQRGYFDGTEPNVHKGEDLDVPTYLRRNLKIILN